MGIDITLEITVMFDSKGKPYFTDLLKASKQNGFCPFNYNLSELPRIPDEFIKFSNLRGMGWYKILDCENWEGTIKEVSNIEVQDIDEEDDDEDMDIEGFKKFVNWCKESRLYLKYCVW